MVTSVIAGVFMGSVVISTIYWLKYLRDKQICERIQELSQLFLNAGIPVERVWFDGKRYKVKTNDQHPNFSSKIHTFEDSDELAWSCDLFSHTKLLEQ